MLCSVDICGWPAFSERKQRKSGSGIRGGKVEELSGRSDYEREKEVQRMSKS